MIKPLLCLLLVFVAVAAGPSVRAQSPTTDASRTKPNDHYFSLCLLTGVGLQFCNRTGGSISISVPYSSTDASGTATNHILTTPAKKVYAPVRPDVAPFGVEIGRLRRFSHFAVSFPLEEGMWTDGARMEAGYGFNWYLNRRKEHYRDPRKKAFVVKTALNVVYSWDRGGDDAGRLGRIDNAAKTVQVLGVGAGPSFTIPGSRYSSSQTYQSEYLNLSYAQREFSLLPRIILSTNPYRYDPRFELAIGYAIPLAERGAIFFAQDDGHSHKQTLEKSVNIDDPAITAVYDGRIIRSVPYRLGGPYLSLAMTFGHKK